MHVICLLSIHAICYTYGIHIYIIYIYIYIYICVHVFAYMGGPRFCCVGVWLSGLRFVIALGQCDVIWLRGVSWGRSDHNHLFHYQFVAAFVPHQRSLKCLGRWNGLRASMALMRQRELYNMYIVDWGRRLWVVCWVGFVRKVATLSSNTIYIYIPHQSHRCR